LIGREEKRGEVWEERRGGRSEEGRKEWRCLLKTRTPHLGCGE
jgi:hypothetical protein